MCMHHEGWYSQCADYFTGEMPNDFDEPTILGILEHLGAEVVKPQRIVQDMEALLDRWHEEGIIRPNAKNRERGYRSLGGESPTTKVETVTHE